MIAVIKNTATPEQLAHFVSYIEGKGLKVDVSRGENETILGFVGDTTQLDPYLIESMDIVERVQRVSEPFKKANRKFHPADTVVDCGHGVLVGGGHFQVIAGPCSVEGDNLLRIARAVREAGATMLRGGAYKPRTSPYAYQGMGERGIRTFETRTRNTFDLNAVPVLHNLSHLPVVGDPSHATGHTRYVTPMALAATAAGVDALEIEVHDDPSHAWSDGAQALTPAQFADTMRRIAKVREAVTMEAL